MRSSTPAARLLLVFAACLAAMLVAALSIASLRDVPPANADGNGAPIERVLEARGP